MGLTKGGYHMKKIVTFAMVASGALALAACGGKTEEAPAAEETASTEMMAPATTETPVASETLDPTGNPIRPAPAAAPAAAAPDAAAAE